jgi:hypothetical protein
MVHRINGAEFPVGPSGGFLTWHERPLLAAQSTRDGMAYLTPARNAIVVQGGLVAEMDFTLQTLQLYRRMHPAAQLILSTWQDADAALLRRAEQLGVQLVLSQRPVYAAKGNVNLQIVSASAGIQAAREAGATHVLKTRADQRLGAPNVLDTLHAMQQAFPLREPTAQRERLMAISLNTFRYRMYGISDMLMYGAIGDMLSYWSPPLDERTFDPAEQFNQGMGANARWRLAEGYLCTEYLDRTAWPMDWTLRDWWRVVAERFCIVDAGSVDLFWPKYSVREMRWTNYNPSQQIWAELDFSSWMLLYSGFDRIESFPEHRLA